LNPVKNLTEIKSWGGRRTGAGRKKDPNSLRAFCQNERLSPYQIRQARKLLDFDAAFGTGLSARVRAGEIRNFQAMSIASFVYVQWESEGKPEQYDAQWANKVKP